VILCLFCKNKNESKSDNKMIFLISTNFELCQERIYHDRSLFLEEKHVTIVHFVPMDDQQLYEKPNNDFVVEVRKISSIYLLINCSRPLRRSSMNSSSNIPSSPRKNAGTCFFQAFDGNDGTTI